MRLKFGHAYGKAAGPEAAAWQRLAAIVSRIRSWPSTWLRYRGLRAPHKIKLGVWLRGNAPARVGKTGRDRHRERLEPYVAGTAA